jgi:hypothetical protein
MPITNGTVHYLRRVKTGDYEHKELQITLSFSHEGEAPGINLTEQATASAIQTVERHLYGKPIQQLEPESDRRTALATQALMDTGRAAATNGMETLKKWWLKLPATTRNEFKDFKELELKPMATKADAQIDNNLAAG